MLGTPCFATLCHGSGRVVSAARRCTTPPAGPATLWCSLFWTRWTRTPDTSLQIHDAHTPPSVLQTGSGLATGWPLAGNWLATGEGLEPSPRVRISSPSSRWDFVMPLGHRRLSLHSLTLPRHCLPTHDTGHAYPTRAARRPHADSTTRPPPGVRAPTRSEVLCFKP